MVKKFLIALSIFLVPLVSSAAYITVPQSTAYGQVLIGNSVGGNYTPVATSTLNISGSGTVTGVTATFPILSSGGTTPNITFVGLSTSSPLVTSNLLYVTGANTVAGVATTSVTCTGSVSCTSFTAIGPSPITINGTGGSSGIATTSVATTTSQVVGRNNYYLFDSTTGILNIGGSATTSPTIVGILDPNTQVFYWKGNVGIGTKSPNYPLEIYGNASSSGTIYADNFYDTSLNSNTCVGTVSSVLTGSTNCVASIAQTYGTGQTGNITLATSTQSYNGQTLGVSITNSTGTFTITPSVSGTLNNTGLTNSSLTVSAGSGLSGGGSVSLGSSITLSLAAANNFGNSWGYIPSYLYPTTTIGVIIDASSTIGNGTTGGGLTIFGGATTTGQDLHLASTTLQNFTFVNATGTQATTTNLYVSSATGIVSAGQVSANNFESTGSTIPLNGFTQISANVLGFANNGLDFLIGQASSTEIGGITITGNSTTSQATTTNFAVSSLMSQLLSTNSNGTLQGASIGAGLGFSANSLSLLSANNFGNSWNQISSTAIAPTTTIGIIVSASSTIGNGTISGGLTIAGGATSTQATTTNENISANAFTISSLTGYINATSTRSTGSIASTSLGSLGHQYSTGTTTWTLGNLPQPIKILGMSCVASTTGTAIYSWSHDNGNVIGSATCTTGSGGVAVFVPTSTNNTFTAFEDIDFQASSTTLIPDRIESNIYYIYTAP